MPKFLKKSLFDFLVDKNTFMPTFIAIGIRTETLAGVPGHGDPLISFFDRKGLMSEEERKPGETTGPKLAFPANKSKGIAFRSD